MESIKMPENGAVVRFLRLDDEEWKDGEFDAENQLFIEIYSTELVTHNSIDIQEWKYLEAN